MGVSRDCPNFLGTPYYPRNGKSYGFQIWPVYLKGPSEQKPIKNFGEKGVWAYPGTAQIFWVPPIMSGTGKATNVKFCTYIYRLNRNKSRLKILRKVAMSVGRDSRKFAGHPYVGRIAWPSLGQLSFLVIKLGVSMRTGVHMNHLMPNAEYFPLMRQFSTKTTKGAVLDTPCTDATAPPQRVRF